MVCGVWWWDTINSYIGRTGPATPSVMSRSVVQSSAGEREREDSLSWATVGWWASWGQDDGWGPDRGQHKHRDKSDLARQHDRVNPVWQFVASKWLYFLYGVFKTIKELWDQSQLIEGKVREV